MQFWGTDFSQLTEAEMQPTLWLVCTVPSAHSTADPAVVLPVGTCLFPGYVSGAAVCFCLYRPWGYEHELEFSPLRRGTPGSKGMYMNV